MIPKNKLREDILSKRLLIYPGAYHPHHKQGLPQFTEPEPFDINEEFDFGKVVDNRHNYKVVFESNSSDLPEEMADVDRDIDEMIGIPTALDKKTHTSPKYNQKVSKVFKQSYRKIGNYRRSK